MGHGSILKYIFQFLYYIIGNYTILSFELFFTRQMGFYMLQVYIPSIVLVSLSWITFFMEPTDVGDRLSIGVTLILTMIFLLGYINQSLPKVFTAVYSEISLSYINNHVNNYLLMQQLSIDAKIIN